MRENERPYSVAPGQLVSDLEVFRLIAYKTFTILFDRNRKLIATNFQILFLTRHFQPQLLTLWIADRASLSLFIFHFAGREFLRSLSNFQREPCEPCGLRGRLR